MDGPLTFKQSEPQRHSCEGDVVVLSALTLSAPYHLHQLALIMRHGSSIVAVGSKEGSPLSPSIWVAIDGLLESLCSGYLQG